ncbi:MAG: transposase [Pseudomonadales bacterium]|nr:transposase [Pseudomonadales bacterium]
MCYDEVHYAAGSWPHERRVIIKGQITDHHGRQPKDNPRFVITNVKGAPRHIYEKIYCAHCDAENRIKELKDGLEIDRTSCSRFLANQLRVLLTAAAYVPIQELRLKARHTRFGPAQVSTIRLHLLKFGAQIESSVRRVVLHLPVDAPFANEWLRIAKSIGAVQT